MKKFLVLAALACAFAVGIVTDADAARAAAGQKTVVLKWRTHAAAYGAGIAGGEGVDVMGGFVDSLCASGIAKFDTTVGIPLADLTLPPASSSLDSLTALRLHIYDCGNLSTVTLGKTSATAESIYIKTQVSPNGKIWFDAAVIAGQAPVLNAFTVQTTVNAAVVTFTQSTNTGISDKMWSMPFMTKPNAAAVRAAVDINHVHEFPFVRWIISGTRATTNHNLGASVTYLSAAAE
jgi:hypothetical protein